MSTTGVTGQENRAPRLRPFADAQHWIVEDDFHYELRSGEAKVIVPRGFVTDFASIPPVLGSLVSRLDRHLLPAVVHDYLYWSQSCSRDWADRIFLKAMGEMRVPPFVRYAFHRAVSSKFGMQAWKQNARDRRNGLPRIVPLDRVRPPKPLESWFEYRDFLSDTGFGPQRPVPGGARCGTTA